MATRFSPPARTSSSSAAATRPRTAWARAIAIWPGRSCNSTITRARPRTRTRRPPGPSGPRSSGSRPAHEEGGKRDWQIKTKQFVSDDRGHVKELHAVRVQQYFDEAGERQFEEIHGTELVFPCELVLLAIGFSGPEPVLPQALEIALTENGAIRSDRRYMTSQPGIFAAGDCRRGQSIVVWAIAEGREAARHIDEYLMGWPSSLRARDRSPLLIAPPGSATL